MKPTGFILYEGPSLIDGQPIVAIAITHSGNSKTGDMVQTYIMRSDINPVHALKTGDDGSVCGRCKHRPVFGGKCYVNVTHGPRSVFEAYKRGRYPHAVRFANLWFPPNPTGVHAIANGTPCIGKGRMVRLGTYGDPAAVPVQVWVDLLKFSSGHTGYTHQWHRAPDLRGLAMASVDTPEEHAQARAMGWRTFRVRHDDSDPLMPREFVCPASHEAGKRLTCADCGACDGTNGHAPNAASVAIVVHGPRAPRRVISIQPSR